jgi:hypothetical protein
VSFVELSYLTFGMFVSPMASLVVVEATDAGELDQLNHDSADKTDRILQGVAMPLARS